MSVRTHDTMMDAVADCSGHVYEWRDGKGFYGYANGPSVAKVRMHIARSAVDSGYYRSIGAALKALVVVRAFRRGSSFSFGKAAP